MSLSQTKEERELFGGEHHSAMARRIKKEGLEECRMALGKGVIGGITEGCSPGGQTWKRVGGK